MPRKETEQTRGAAKFIAQHAPDVRDTVRLMRISVMPWFMTPLEACTFGARLGNRSLFILVGAFKNIQNH